MTFRRTDMLIVAAFVLGVILTVLFLPDILPPNTSVFE